MTAFCSRRLLDARSVALAASLIGLLIGQAVVANAANLIKNGSFEKPVVPNGGSKEFVAGSDFSGWLVTGGPGNVAVVSGTFAANGFSFPAKKGAQWLDLTGSSNSRTGLIQAVTTTPGQEYLLTFYAGNVYNPGGPYGLQSEVEVFV